jgi:SAM-dependent methyltransferase
MNSFSKEWSDYDYDGIMWDLSYEDHEARFLAEIGSAAARTGRNGVFLEVGCGLGLTTQFAYKNLEADAIGLDLSLAVLKASEHFRNHPFLHFVQGSAFYLPLRSGIADVVYSHGVLHHTYSTREAFRAIAQRCRPSGVLYVWVYGPDSQKGSLLRRAAYHLETAVRPAIGQNPDSITSRMFLNVVSCGYLVLNLGHRIRNPEVQAYSFQKALHAARDRFTPLYAHRHDYEQVAEWFREEGFQLVERVDWRLMPSANRDNFRRNTSVRGRRVAGDILASAT